MSVKIFISYAHDDYSLVSRLVAILGTASQFEIWFDDRLPGARAWEPELLRQIQACDVFLYAITPESYRSEWCQWEFSQAVHAEKKIVPVLMQKTTLTGALADHQHVNYTQGDSSEFGVRLVDAVYAAELIPRNKVPLRPSPNDSGGPPTTSTTGKDDPSPTPRPAAVRRSAAPKGDIPVPEMVPVPAGPFLMGVTRQQDPQAAPEETPQISVPLPQYEISKYLVTVEEFRAFVKDGYKKDRWWTYTGWKWREQRGIIQPEYWEVAQWTGDPRLPVIGVSWYEAWAYTQWLNEMLGASYAAPQQVIRLPKETEWEKAARGEDGQLFPWEGGFDILRCNTGAIDPKRTTPVGRYSPEGDSPYGCADMLGNVTEWTLTQAPFWRYEAGPETMNNMPEGDRSRIARGGSWDDPISCARTTARYSWDADSRSNVLGFRVVRGEPV